MKYVLDTIPIFWMTLFDIPSSILSKLRNLAFSFLWIGEKRTKGIHLSSWESLAKPYNFG